MSFSWQLAGQFIASPDEMANLTAENSFDTRHDAEIWVGNVWPELVDLGVETVTLMDGDTAITEPMDLT